MVNTSFLITGILALATSLPLAVGHEVDGGADLAARDLHVANARHIMNTRKAKRDEFVKRYTETNNIARRAISTSDPFNGAITTCVLAPEEEIGPHYIKTPIHPL